ncbi:glycosyltransferase family 25 protein [Xylariaceae sp. FL0016]|nr:glycosyltransferase family 25 protein [Xylariaceae sp. FL0016]
MNEKSPRLPWVKPAVMLSKRFFLGFCCALVILIFCTSGLEPNISYRDFEELGPSISSSRHSISDSASNATLGFQNILALSPAPSWRTRGLEAAARLTGLHITVPRQPKNPDAFIHAFQSIGQETGNLIPELGSAKAWMAHLDLLKHVVANEIETALIMEDDVDWDVRIKDQMRLVWENVRKYTSNHEDEPAPDGDDWDVLWLGHCGSTIEDYLPEPLQYADGTRCRTEDYLGWSKIYVQGKLSEGYRQVQYSSQTVCTFAYAVTKSSAQKVLDLTGTGASEAFDVALEAYCRQGALRCLVINPQVFNHYEPPSEEGYVSIVHVGDSKGVSSDESSFEDRKGATVNIVRSARCAALFDDTCMMPTENMWLNQ